MDVSRDSMPEGEASPEPEPEPAKEGTEKKEEKGDDPDFDADETPKKKGGCCSNKDPEDEPAYKTTMGGPLHKPNQHMTDQLCCIIFLVFCFFEFCMVFAAYNYGDVNRLLNPTDYWESTCGFVNASGHNLTSAKLAHYPRMAEDIQTALLNAQNCQEDVATGSLGEDCKVNLYTVCVERCPQSGEIVCNYEAEAEHAGILANFPLAEQAKERGILRRMAARKRKNCWMSPLNTYEAFQRCVPDIKIEQTKTITCDEGSGPKEIEEREMDFCTGMVSVSESSATNTTGGADQLGAALISSTYKIKQELADSYSVWQEIVVFGFGASFVVSWVFVVFMQYLASCVIWGIVIMVWLLFVTITVCLFTKTESAFGQALPTLELVRSVAQQEFAAGSLLAAVDPMDPTSGYETYDISAHIFLLLSILFLILLIVVRKQIMFTVKVVVVASKSLQAAKLLPFLPFSTWAFQFVTMTFYGASAIFIYTATIDASDINSMVDAAKSAGKCQDMAQGNHTTLKLCLAASIDNMKSMLEGSAGADANSTTADPELDLAPPAMKVSEGSVTDYMMMYHLFGFLWTTQLFDAFGLIAMSATIAEIYWTKEMHKKEGKWATFNGIWYALRYKLGTAIFGAFVVALVQFIRMMINYVVSKMEQVAGKNAVMQKAIIAINMIVYVIEKIVKYLTRNAYIMCAIAGKGFCRSAYASFKLLVKNISRIGVVQLTTWLLKNLAVFGIAGCAGVGCYIYLSVMPEFRYDRNVTLRGERPIFNPYTPATFSFFFGLVISIAFLHVFSMSVDTVLFSFLHDEQLMKEGKYNGIEKLKNEETGKIECVTQHNWPGLYDYMTNECPTPAPGEGDDQLQEKGWCPDAAPSWCPGAKKPYAQIAPGGEGGEGGESPRDGEPAAEPEAAP